MVSIVPDANSLLNNARFLFPEPTPIRPVGIRHPFATRYPPIRQRVTATYRLSQHCGAAGTDCGFALSQASWSRSEMRITSSIASSNSPPLLALAGELTLSISPIAHHFPLCAGVIASSSASYSSRLLRASSMLSVGTPFPKSRPGMRRTGHGNLSGYAGAGGMEDKNSS